MVFKTVDHISGSDAAITDLRDRLDDTDGNAVLIRVEEAAADSTVGDIACEQPCKAFAVLHPEAPVDLFLTETDDFFDTDSDLFGLKLFFQAQLLGEQGVDTVCQKNAVRVHLLFTGQYTDSLAALVSDHLIHTDPMDEHGPGLLSLLCEPGIQIRAKDRIACFLRLAHLFIIIFECCSCLFRKEGNPLTDDLAFHRSLLGKSGENFLHGMSVHASSGYGFLSRFFRAFDDQNFHFRLSKKVSGYTSRNASSHDYDVKFFLCHILPFLY